MSVLIKRGVDSEVSVSSGGRRTGEEAEGHRDLVDLEMCSKINTKTFCIYTMGNSTELHLSSDADMKQLIL